MLPHIDLSTVIGIAGGMIGIAGVFRTANLGALSSKINELNDKVTKLTTRCEILETNLEEERKKVGLYYGQASDFKDENIALRKEIQAKDDKIIVLQDELTGIYKNTLKAVQ